MAGATVGLQWVVWSCRDTMKPLCKHERQSEMSREALVKRGVSGFNDKTSMTLCRWDLNGHCPNVTHSQILLRNICRRNTSLVCRRCSHKCKTIQKNNNNDKSGVLVPDACHASFVVVAETLERYRWSTRDWSWSRGHFLRVSASSRALRPFHSASSRSQTGQTGAL